MQKLLLAVLVGWVAAASLGAQADPYSGVWVRRPTPDGGSQVLTIKVANGEEDYTSELTSPEGRRQVTRYVARYDGKDVVSKVLVTQDGKTTTHDEAVVLTKTDERRRERQSKLKGRTYRILHREVSVDGKVLTSRLIEIDEQSQQRTGATLVFDRK